MIRLRAFGSPSLERDAESLGGAARQRRVLGLLAFVAAARDRGVSRDSVLATLWSDAEPEKARQALTQALYHARRAVNEEDLFLTGSDLRLNAAVFTTDIWAFEDALTDGDRERAVAMYEGAFLEGFYVNDAPEFERWVADERARLDRLYGNALDQLAEHAERGGDPHAALQWRRRRAALDPLNAAAALDLMRAFAAAGDRAGALQHARVYETLLREELDVAPDTRVVEFTERLRRNEIPVIDAPSHARARVGNAAPASVVVPETPNEQRDDARDPPLAERVEHGRVRTRDRRMFAVIGLTAIATIFAALIYLTREPKAVAPQKDLIAVVPFRVSGADASLAFLGEGLVDLLTTKLTDAGTTQPVDAGSMIAAWHHAGLTPNSGATRDAALNVARGFGAERLLVGSVVGAPNHLVISASLITVADGSVQVQASVEGPTDSLTVMIDRMVARLVAQAAGMSARLANHTTTSPRAMRAFLDGQAAYRRGAYREALGHFRGALEHDPTFAMAGLGLAQAADRVSASSDVTRGLTIASQYRAELIERDRLYLEALAGPRYPAPSSERERIVAWERVVATTPDRAEAWVGLGRQLFYRGKLLGIGDADERAVAAFERARELDDGLASPLLFLVQLTARRNDTAAVRAAASTYLQLDSIGDLAGFVRWRSTLVLGDTARLTSLRRAFSRMPAPSLRSIALSSLYNATGDDAERALASLRARTARAGDRLDLRLAEHAVALNRGAMRRAQQVIDAIDDAQPMSTLAVRLRVLDALYAEGDSAVAVRSAIRLAPQLSATALRGAVASSVTPDAEDLCVAAQWHAWRGSPQTAARAVANLTSLQGPTAATCSTLVHAVLAVRGRGADAESRTAQLDSVLLSGPSSEVTEYGNLALARLYTTMGNIPRALAAARRQSYMVVWPSFLAVLSREEGKLATASGDLEGAAAAYQRYLALRSNPDAEILREVETVRDELRRLTTSP